jgi:CPA1 family monovalent cation:H+ antiporter
MVGQFGLIAVGGIMLGVAMGWITTQIQERLDDPMLELAMSLTTPFATYLLCEWLQVSGVLGIVRGRLVSLALGARRHLAAARLNILAFWRAVVFVVNCLVFVLIGIQLPAISTSLIEHQALSWPRVAGLVAVLSLVAIGVRFLWIFTATYGVRPAAAIRPEKRDPASARVSTLVSWCGMRGVVSLAAALAIPLTLPGGEPFPYRDLVILLASASCS